MKKVTNWHLYEAVPFCQIVINGPGFRHDRYRDFFILIFSGN